jgi:hypothetical protein
MRLSFAHAYTDPVTLPNPVLVDVEVLAHQLAQQRVGVLDRFLC